MEPVATETVTLVTQRLRLGDARAAIAAHARVFELQIDSVEEHRRRFSAELRVTVTGAPNMIEGFRKELGSDTLDTMALYDHSPGDWAITMLLRWLRSMRRRRRARKRSD